MGIMENAKEVADLIKKYNDLDLYQKILDLRDEILQLREENITLKEELRQLKIADEIKAKIYRKGNCYYVKNEDGEDSGPYCLACWDTDKCLVNLILKTTRWGTNITCGHCEKHKQNK